jgi:hypothetical protein
MFNKKIVVLLLVKFNLTIKLGLTTLTKIVTYILLKYDF